MTVGSNNARQFRDIFGSVIPFKSTIDLASIADQAEGATDITVAGAALGDIVIGSISVDQADLVANFYVSAADTVTVTLANVTAGAVDLASAVFSGVVLQRGNAFDSLSDT